MKKTLLLFILFLTYLPNILNATNHIINYQCCQYSPNTGAFHVGDSVTWVGTGGATFTQHPLASTTVPGGAAAFQPTVGSVFTYVIMVPGTYFYWCQIHGPTGMTGNFTATGSTNVEEANTTALSLNLAYYGGYVRLTTDAGTDHTNLEVHISNILGQTACGITMRADENEKMIDIQQFPEGLYILTVADERQRTYIRKFRKD